MSLRILFIVLLSLLSSVISLSAQPLQWTQRETPCNYSGMAVACTPNGELFVGGSGLWHRSLDSTNWHSIFSSIPVELIVPAPNNRIFVSWDHRIGVTNENNDSVRWLRICDTWINTAVITATGRLIVPSRTGLSRTNDFGATWDEVTNTPFTYPKKMVISSTGAIYALTETSLWRSLDEGLTWTQVGTGLPIGGLSDLSLSPSLMLCGTTSNGLFSSIDSGNTWHHGGTGINEQHIQRVYFTSSSLYAVTWNATTQRDRFYWYNVSIHVFEPFSDTTWIPRTDLNTTMCSAPDGDLIAFYKYFRGINRLHNGSFTSLNSGFPNSISNLLADSNIVFAQDATVSRSFDDGWTWGTCILPFDDTLRYRSPMIRTPNGSLLFCSESHLYRSADHGESWSISDAISGAITMGVSQQGTLLSTHWSYSINRSIDDGVTWTSFPIPVQHFSVVNCINGTQWIAVSEDSIFHSNDDGLTWLNIGRIQSASYIYNLTLTSSGTLLAGGIYGIFRSIDLGVNWSRIGTPNFSPLVNTFKILSNGDILAGTNSEGVYRSSDDGLTWTQENANLPNLQISSITQTANGLIYVGTPSGVFVCENFVGVTPNPERKVPVSITLEQATPNPFNPTTELSYTINTNGVIELVAFDVQGRQAAVLASGRFRAGKYKATFDGRNLTSGIYFIRLTANGIVSTRKVTLLK